VLVVVGGGGVPVTLCLKHMSKALAEPRSEELCAGLLTGEAEAEEWVLVEVEGMNRTRETKR